LAGILSGIGGVAGNFFGKNRQRGAQGGGGGVAPPSYYDPVPQNDDGKVNLICQNIYRGLIQLEMPIYIEQIEETI
jgi:hypothetical protein